MSWPSAPERERPQAGLGGHIQIRRVTPDRLAAFQFDTFKAWHGSEALPGPSVQAQVGPYPELAIGRAVEGVRVGAGRDGVGPEMLKTLAIVAEKTALRADPEETLMILVQGEYREVGQALVNPVYLEFPMLRMRCQGTEKPTRTENPNSRPHTHSVHLSV